MSEAVSPDMLPLIVGHMAQGAADLPPLLEPENLIQPGEDAAKTVTDDMPLKK
jgi:hypothetical protein